MNRQDLINRLVARKLQPAGNGKNLCHAAKVLCGCHAAKVLCIAPRQQTPMNNFKG
jgi:hypothetical protein